MAALACLFLSGAAALIAQVCWVRRAGLAFGSTVYALSTVLAVFFLGLALGSLLFGERSRRVARPLRVYAVIELGLAVLIAASPLLFELAESIYGAIYRTTDSAGLVSVARAGLVGLVILIPATLMGASLPLVTRQLVDSRARMGAVVGTLYSVNTLGAAGGALLCGLVLLPQLGMRQTLLLAAGIELVAAALAAVAGWQRTAPAPIATPARPAAWSRTPPLERPLLVAALFFCTGFVALGNEVLWTRFLAVVTPSTVLSYTIALAVVLVGIVVGSAIAAGVVDRGWPRARLFGALQVTNGVAALAVVLLPPELWRAAGEWWAQGLLLLLPAALSGAAFPLAVRMVVDDPAAAGAGVGRMAAANTLGGIAGSLVIGFVLLPQFGLQTSLLCTTGIALASGSAAWWWLDGAARPSTRAVAIAACVLAWLAVPRLLATRVPQDLLAAPHELVAFREGREANLAVISRHGTLQLEADRWWQGQDRKTHQVLAGHLPLFLHAAPRRVLVVGVGAGQTPASVLTHDVERLDCVDIEPAVFDVVRAHFDHAWMDDARVHLIRDDGRTYVAHTAARYDVITLEVGQLSRPGVATFYTADFYALARAHLEPNGIVSQFVPLTFLTPQTFRDLLATFLSVFPHSVLWYNTTELLLIGVNGDRIELPAPRLAKLLQQPRVNADLRYGHWGGPAHWLNQPPVFLGGFLAGPRQLAALAAGGTIERDDRPTLAYAARRARSDDRNELPILEMLHPQLASIVELVPDAPPDLLGAATRERERNLADAVASAELRRVDALTAAGQDAEVVALLDAALRANPDNARAHRLLGDVAFRQRRADDARTHYARALAIDPDDGAAHLALARLLLQQGRTADAVPHYRAAIAQRPNDPEAHNDFAAALFQQGDLAGAERELGIALRISPAYPPARENLARLQAQRGR